MTNYRRKPSPLMNSIQGRVDDLGKGLVGNNSTMNHTFEVDVVDIEADPDQARQIFSEKDLNELSESLCKHGQLAPILVRPKKDVRGKWIIVAGERRWRAAQIAGITQMLAIERTTEHEIASLIENLQREDLNPVEEAIGISKVSIKYNWSQRELAKRFGKSVSDINGMLAIARLPEAFCQSVLNSEHRLSRNLLIELARLPHTTIREKCFQEALEGNLTIPKLRDYQTQIESSVSEDTLPSEISKKAKKTGLRSPAEFIQTVNRRMIKLEGLSLDEKARQALIELHDRISHLLG